MTTYTSHYPAAYNSTYVKASTYYSTSYYPWFCIDPSKSVTGADTTGAWITTDSALPQKINIDHGSAFVASRVYVENFHSSGTIPLYGLKNISVYGTNSATAFANTDGTNTTDLTLLGSFTVAAHVSSNVADPQYFSIVGNTTSYRYTVIIIVDRLAAYTRIGVRRIEIQSTDAVVGPVSSYVIQGYCLSNDVKSYIAQVFGLRLGSMLEQLYPILPTFFNFLDQNYGLRLGATLDQTYFDAPRMQNHLTQVYRDASQLQRALVQMWGDAARLTGYIEQPFAMPEFLQQSLEQKYAITGDALLGFLAQQYDLSQYNLIKTYLDQIYVIAPAGSLYYHPTITVTVGGVEIHPYHINIEGGRDEFAMSCEVHLTDQKDYLVCQLLDELVVTVDAEVFTFLIHPKPTRSRQVGSTSYIVKGSSAAMMLDEPFATPLLEQIGPGMASVLVANLADLEDIDVEWEIVDWYIKADTLYANNESPLAIIRKISDAAGAILQSGPDGTLYVRKYYPYPVPEWSTATPSFFLTDQDNFYTLAEQPDTRPGYNKYTISDQLSAQSGVTLEEKQISDTVKEIRAYQVPWDGLNRPLLHSGGSWVTIEPMGSAMETITTEQIEIVNGTGRTSKPIYTMINRDYKQVVLGAISFSEDGTLKTEIVGQSLVEVTYQTMYWKFKVTDQQKEAVQCYVEELTS